MNREETTKLTRYVKAACPQQAIDDYTPDVWFDFLRDLDPGDCLQAVQAIIGRQPFVAVAEIVAEVRRIRDGRLSNSDLAIPAADPSDTRSYGEALRDITRRLADGRQPFRAIEGGHRAEPSEAFKRARSAQDNDRVLAQTVPCPVEWCRAIVAEPCIVAATGHPHPVGHPSRVKAARAAKGIPA